MSTIKLATLNSDGSYLLTTDTGVNINIAPRIPMDTNVVLITPNPNTDLSIAALLNMCADLTDRITHQESRMSELVNYIRNIASALPTSTVPTETAVSEQASTEQAVLDSGPRIVRVSELTPE
jgi:hypothetical protein